MSRKPAHRSRIRCGIIKTIFSLALAVSFLAAGRGHAAEWPTHTVTVVVPFSAGGNTDVIARIAAEHLQKTFGQAFIVTNRTGANGAIAARMVARAEPDGYTLMIAAAPQLVVLPALQRLDFDPLKDFTPIKNIATNPFVLVVSRSVRRRLCRRSSPMRARMAANSVTHPPVRAASAISRAPCSSRPSAPRPRTSPIKAMGRRSTT